MSTAGPLGREEYIEQAYFFRTFRERLKENMSSQEILERMHEEILTTTRLPYAVQFLCTELRHTGLLSMGFMRLPHYFTTFQTFVISQAEEESHRFTMLAALAVLEREAEYKAHAPTQQGLFVYQFETICRNRLGYTDGLMAMAADDVYDEKWRGYLTWVRKQVGVLDFADLVYLRSQTYVQEQRRFDPAYEPPVGILFGEKEGKIARASRGRDPLFLFAALQRQLQYPEVPRAAKRDDVSTQLGVLKQQIAELENRIKLVEGELRGSIDWSEFGTPDLLEDDDDRE